MEQLVKASPINPATYPMHAWMIEEIQAWDRGNAAVAAFTATVNKYQNWLTQTFNQWFINYSAGRASEPAPAPPNGFDAFMTEDGLTYDLIDSGAACGPAPNYKRNLMVAPQSIFGTGNGAPAVAVPFPGAELFKPVTAPDGRVFQRIA